jgi:hypothetical protein
MPKKTTSPLPEGQLAFSQAEVAEILGHDLWEIQAGCQNNDIHAVRSSNDNSITIPREWVEAVLEGRLLLPMYITDPEGWQQLLATRETPPQAFVAEPVEEK